MCLAIPMKIKNIENKNNATGVLSEIERRINISLVEDVKKGDYVMVHAGFAIEKVDEEFARETLELLKQIEI